MPRYRSITDPDTPERMSISTDSSVSEDIPHASTLTLPELEALLAQQEAHSRDALGSALAKKQEAEHLIEQASKAEDEAQSFRITYEEAEVAIQELRQLIVEKNKQILERQFDSPIPSRPSAKRPSPPDQESNVARKRVATDTAIKREPSTTAESDPSGEHVEDTRQSGAPYPRFIRLTKANAMVLPRNDATPKADELVIYTNGQLAKAMERLWPVCAIVFATSDPSRQPKHVAFSMERKGPTGMICSTKGLRAALRAVVGALEVKIWGSEFKQVTIAVDNADIFHGLTDHIGDWHTAGALETRSSIKLNNKDLWIRALDLVNEQTYNGCEVRFWLISAKQNKKASNAARAIDPSEKAPDSYRPCGDVGSTFKEAL